MCLRESNIAENEYLFPRVSFSSSPYHVGLHYNGVRESEREFARGRRGGEERGGG